MGDALGATAHTLESYGWELFAAPLGGKFVWARVPHVGNAERLVACGAPLGVTVAPGSYFRPNMEMSPWTRIHAAFGNDPRAQAFFRAAVALPPSD
jgi:DNA-binding transcriptional MocR family regulator